MESNRVVRLGALLVVLLCATPARADDRDWARWVQRQISALPTSQAIDANQQQALADSDARAQPRYNPALNIGYEESADTTRTVGLSQTLDWSGKARAARSLADIEQQQIRLRSERARARVRADALQALTGFAAARDRLAA
ncbi:MAG: TolC family protein, partial [Alcanivorax sp.]|nr:TolC family protein [Alcanivorax sp.]